MSEENQSLKEKKHFISETIEEDFRSKRFTGTVHTRFPPEPNGYLHIGHAKAICLNFGLAQQYNGQCNLRFDDTNPIKEEVEYINAIKRDVQWLGFNWGDQEYYASDYFDKLYELAISLIKKGKAYVCDLSTDQIRDYRGTLTEPGKESPYRNRSVDENLDLFEKMKSGDFPDGSKVLRAKIDMSSGNLNMRDPVMYRILKANHPRIGNKWSIYPMYDWAHGQSDSFEKITHSICTLEFEAHRPLYDWFIEQLEIHHPRQIEFARLNLAYTVMSKRKLLALVKEGLVKGWDDPRMPTLAGLRRRGYTPKSLREFCDRIGVAKRDSLVDYALLDFCLREDLNKTVHRVMGVLRPLKLMITNYPDNQVDELECINNPEDPEQGKRKVPFSKEIYIERADFMEDPPKKFYRLAPGREVRLRYAYYVTCQEVIKDEKTGEVIEVRCTYDPESKGGSTPDKRKIKATLHWVSAKHALKAEGRLYDHLFNKPEPEKTEKGKDFRSNINPNSLEVISPFWVEPSLKGAKPESRYQFERLGYFCIDPDSPPEKPIINRITTLRDTWAKVQSR